MGSEKWWDQKLGFTYVSMKSHWNLPGHMKYCVVAEIVQWLNTESENPILKGICDITLKIIV